MGEGKQVAAQVKWAMPGPTPHVLFPLYIVLL